MRAARNDDLIIVGAGVFGLGTALEATRRGYAVTVVDRGPIPHPAAASNGPSRKLRSTYLDPAYSSLVIDAMTAWDDIAAATGQVCFERLGNLVYTVNDHHPTLDAFQAASERAGGRIERLRPSRAATPLPDLPAGPRRELRSRRRCPPGDDRDPRHRDARGEGWGADRPRWARPPDRSRRDATGSWSSPTADG